jgi:hypothetical protein
VELNTDITLSVLYFYSDCKSIHSHQHQSGPLATFLGRGDLHDQKYTSMGERTSFFDLDKYSTVKSRYTGIPINEEYCTFSVTIFPSNAMKQQFISSNPLIVASVLFLIFVLTLIGILIYDTKVERRQKVVMTTAVRSTTMLSSLFPANVCDQLLEEDSVTNNNNRPEEKTKGNRLFFVEMPKTHWLQ